MNEDKNISDFSVQIVQPDPGYELIDSGENEKLERYGEIVLARPDPQALWVKSQPQEVWDRADAVFKREKEKGQWHFKHEIPKEWTISFSGFSFVIKPTAFKHTGLFPEQASNWKWIMETITAAARPVKILNLFGYTGGATLAAASAGAEVIHVDGSKAAVTWAKQNVALSGLSDKPIRWIVDDARRFLRREVKRGNHYDGIILDPPLFGRGPEGEVWKIEDDLMSLLDLCKNILCPKPLFVLLNGYAAGYSAITYSNNLRQLVSLWSKTVELGELTIQEKDTDRLLPAGIFARWRAK